MRKISILFSTLLCSKLMLFAQDTNITTQRLKLSHAEPLYIDLIRDLGARQGEQEFNVGAGFNDYRNFVNYSGFIEYEFAPLNRLGLEIEVPFQFYRSFGAEEEIPGNKIEGLKLATQYTFLVSEQHQASLALGYIQEFEMEAFGKLRRGEVLGGMIYNPIFVAAKRWTPQIHTLLYTGPVIEQDFGSSRKNFSYELNASFHYILSGTASFIGLETNVEFSGKQAAVVFRPQVKFRIAGGMAIGWVTGIPVDFKQQGISSMIRLIWEPKKNQK